MEQSVKSRPFSGKPVEMISFDLAPLRGYPQFTAIVDWLGEPANPPHCWGTMSRRQVARRYKLHTEKQQLETGAIQFAGQTLEQNDLEVIEDMRADLLMHTSWFEGGCSDELLRRLYELDWSYYEMTYPSEGPAQKSIKLPSVVTLAAPPTKHQAGVLRKLLATVKKGERVFSLRLTYEQRCMLMRKDWVESVKLDVDYSGASGDKGESNFATLVVLRDKLLAELLQQFGETAYVKTLLNPQYVRISVHLRKDGLVAGVTFTDEENRARKTLEIGGKSYESFLAQVPKAFGGFPVTLQVMTLDRSATASETNA